MKKQTDVLKHPTHPVEDPGQGIDAGRSRDNPAMRNLAEDEAGPSTDFPQPAPMSPLGAMLMEAGMLSREQATIAQDAARRERLPLWRILVRDGLVFSKDLAALTALYLGLPLVDLHNQVIDPQAVASLPEQIARKFSVLPIQTDEARLTVAMADPMDLRLIQDLAARTERTVEPVVAISEDILEHIDVSYRLVENSVEEGFAAAELPGGRVTATLLRDAPPAKIIELLLHQGLQDRASDIHIEPTESGLRIRFRIVG